MRVGRTLAETRAFFASRAATWDTTFGDDLPAYTRAVEEAGFVRDGTVVDLGCGTGRALASLRDAVGPRGTVLGLDVTEEMLAVAAHRACHDGTCQHGACRATLLLADARRLPFADRRVDGIFAAGLLQHLADPYGGLVELARVTRPGGRLALFHPSGRVALAARHGHELRPDEPLAEVPLNRSTRKTGWRLEDYDDAPDRFFALAVRLDA